MRLFALRHTPTGKFLRMEALEDDRKVIYSLELCHSNQDVPWFCPSKSQATHVAMRRISCEDSDDVVPFNQYVDFCEVVQFDCNEVTKHES